MQWALLIVAGQHAGGRCNDAATMLWRAIGIHSFRIESLQSAIIHLSSLAFADLFVQPSCTSSCDLSSQLVSVSHLPIWI